MKPRAVIILHGVLAGADGRVQLWPVQLQPSELNLERNDYRTADTLRVTVEWPSLPVDPRQFAAGGVDLYLGAAGPDGALALGPDTIAFSGHVDSLEQVAGGDGVALRLECRDFTALFLDAPWTSTVPLGPLLSVLNAIVAEVPGAAGLTVELADLPDADLRIPQGRTRYSPPDGANAWTVMTDLVRRVGGVLYVQENRIVAAGPRTLFPTTEAPTLIWGQDLSRLEIKQELKAQARRGVELTSRDPVSGEVVTARYPTASSRLVVDGRRRKVAEADSYLEWAVAGVPRAQAPDVARRIWEAQARGQAVIRAETSRMATVDGAWTLRHLRHSDPVSIVSPARSRRGLPEVPEADLTAYLAGPAVGMEPSSAAAFAKVRDALIAADLPLYTRRARHEWSAAGGYQLNLELSTYVTLGGP